MFNLNGVGGYRISYNLNANNNPNNKPKNNGDTSQNVPNDSVPAPEARNAKLNNKKHHINTYRTKDGLVVLRDDLINKNDTILKMWD